jgi:hypothetical protein
VTSTACNRLVAVKDSATASIKTVVLNIVKLRLV